MDRSVKRLLATLLVAGFPATALAHQLNVFAFVEDGSVIVESRFSNGNAPRLGEVRVLDAENQLIAAIPLAENGTAEFPLDPAHSDAGLLIEVSTGEGHSNYWILTSEDIERGLGD